MSFIWLTKLILAHLLTDFMLQRTSWITERKEKHFQSPYLYVHTFITAFVAWVFTGWNYWIVALIILVTHTLIDVWKSYRPDEVVYFLLDQLLHFIVILSCWVFTFFTFNEIKDFLEGLNGNGNFWVILTAIVFLTFPSSIIVGELTKMWRQKLPNPGALASAGKWIGIIERILILILILKSQYEATGLLIAAKTIIRFADNERTEEKTEYLLIGTLISIGFAVLTGVVVVHLGS